MTTLTIRTRMILFLLAVAIVVAWPADAQLNPRLDIDAVSPGSTIVTISWDVPPSPPPFYTIMLRDSLDVTLTQCFTGTLISPSHCAWEPIPAAVTAHQTTITTPIDSLAVTAWVRMEGQSIGEVTPPVWLYAYAPTPPPPTPVLAPDFVIEGGFYLAARTMLDMLADAGYPATLHAGDTQVNWGNRTIAAQHCGVAHNNVQSIENGETDYIPAALKSCYRDHLVTVTGKSGFALVAALLVVWAR